MGIWRSRLAILAILVAVSGIAAVVLIDRGSSSANSGAAIRATQAEDLAAEFTANDFALREAIDAWRAGGDPPKAPPPKEVKQLALYVQQTVRTLARHPTLARNTVELLPAPLGGEIRELTASARDLYKLSAGWPSQNIKTGPPRPLAELMRYYDAAFRRYRVGQHYLAAVHLVESKFGRVKNDSVAGAQGPMQFLPSTWDIYGKGNIHDPHDAILAAANLLHDRGAPGDYRRALYAYNPSWLYVDAVQRYARLIKSDAYAVYFLYCWGP